MKYCDIPAQQRERVRRLAAKLCTCAVEYKGVRPEACMECESPCGYGVELVSAVGLEMPKRNKIGDAFEQVEVGRDRKVRRIMRSMNRSKP